MILPSLDHYLITPVKSLCCVRSRLQILGIRVWTPLGRHCSVYHTSNSNLKCQNLQFCVPLFHPKHCPCLASNLCAIIYTVVQPRNLSVNTGSSLSHPPCPLAICECRLCTRHCSRHGDRDEGTYGVSAQRVNTQGNITELSMLLKIKPRQCDV